MFHAFYFKHHYPANSAILSLLFIMIFLPFVKYDYLYLTIYKAQTGFKTILIPFLFSKISNASFHDGNGNWCVTRHFRSTLLFSTSYIAFTHDVQIDPK